MHLRAPIARKANLRPAVIAGRFAFERLLIMQSARVRRRKQPAAETALS
jgi:hypothetical protein